MSKLSCISLIILPNQDYVEKSKWIAWIVLKSVLFNWLGPTSHDIVILTLLTTIQAIHAYWKNIKKLT